MPTSVSVMMLTYIVTSSASILSLDIVTIIDHCAYASSIATNLLATLLIAYKLWLVNISSDINDYCLSLTGSIEKPSAILV